LISSACGTAAAVLVLGIVGGCCMSAAGQYPGTRARALGITALVRVLAPIIASTIALAMLVMALRTWWPRLDPPRLQHPSRRRVRRSAREHPDQPAPGTAHGIPGLSALSALREVRYACSTFGG
jgi:hypothetical protein